MRHAASDNTTVMPHGGLRAYTKGFVLAIILTAIAFGLVMASAHLPRAFVLGGIFAAAIVQVMVHLHYFLHLDMSREQRWNLHSILFAALIISIMVVGTLWIMNHLHLNMAYHALSAAPSFAHGAG